MTCMLVKIWMFSTDAFLQHLKKNQATLRHDNLLYKANEILCHFVLLSSLLIGKICEWSLGRSTFVIYNSSRTTDHVFASGVLKLQF